MQLLPHPIEFIIVIRSLSVDMWRVRITHTNTPTKMVINCHIICSSSIIIVDSEWNGKYMLKMCSTDGKGLNIIETWFTDNSVRNEFARRIIKLYISFVTSIYGLGLYWNTISVKLFGLKKWLWLMFPSVNEILWLRGVVFGLCNNSFCSFGFNLIT